MDVTDDILVIDLSPSLLALGGVNSLVGTLTARTLMLAELSLLLQATGEEASSHDELRRLVINENVCAKNSLTTRQKTFRHLRELYGLSNDLALWRALRSLWWQAPTERPILALLLAFAREPLLRLTWELIRERAQGEPVTPAEFDAIVEQKLPGNYRENTRRSLGQNCASAWAQSGHLTSTSPKRRARAQGGPASVTLALYLSFLEGLAPARCFESRFAALLDAPLPVLDSWAFEAHKSGWLDYRRIDQVVHLDFARLEKLAQ